MIQEAKRLSVYDDNMIYLIENTIQKVQYLIVKMAKLRLEPVTSILRDEKPSKWTSLMSWLLMNVFFFLIEHLIDGLIDAYMLPFLLLI